MQPYTYIQLHICVNVRIPIKICHLNLSSTPLQQPPRKILVDVKFFRTNVFCPEMRMLVWRSNSSFKTAQFPTN